MTEPLTAAEEADYRELCRDHPNEPDWFGTGSMAKALASLDALREAVGGLLNAAESASDHMDGLHSGSDECGDRLADAIERVSRALRAPQAEPHPEPEP